jgi:Transmembrane protein 33/Nucleoporin POM33
MPHAVTLVPFLAFSTFHTLTYLRSEFFPKLFPSGSYPFSAAVIPKITTFVSQYQPKAVAWIARFEIWVIFRNDC